ncbi:MULTISPECIES: LuxR C-terminal-related transcriptional regulator [Clostridia]|nr:MULTISPECIES: LuxR C-terminal-related transcriptional regulator [Clostridia]NBJ68936.1 DNA-binding response regulator [Roseburia sp. 1XD42-34]RKI79841.1 DNA-binding response regulator [Clostridium sp. 1xD42-85]
MKDNEYKPKQLLTKREKEVFELLVQDKTTKEIAQELFISEKTVRNHISNAMHTNCKCLKKRMDNGAIGCDYPFCIKK